MEVATYNEETNKLFFTTLSTACAMTTMITSRGSRLCRLSIIATNTTARHVAYANSVFGNYTTGASFTARAAKCSLAFPAATTTVTRLLRCKPCSTRNQLRQLSKQQHARLPTTTGEDYEEGNHGGFILTEDMVRQHLDDNAGVVFANPAIVHRPTYAGRSILAPNSEFKAGVVDARGYVPVEWWLMSLTEAVNEDFMPGEGITKLRFSFSDIFSAKATGNKNHTQQQQVSQEQQQQQQQLQQQQEFEVSLPDAVAAAPSLLLGDYAEQWPLTKLLDIGGAAVTPSYSETAEVPPIPCHVHAGTVSDGQVRGPGKLEAYFFPPTNVAPYCLPLEGVTTRIGVRKDVSPANFERCLAQFGRDDSMYELLQSYPVKPYENWTVPTHVAHAPGPWPTFEVQRPQDDYNLLAWQLGRPLEEGSDEAHDTKAGHQLRGLSDEADLMRQTIDWDQNVDPDFESKWRRDCETLETGDWGRRLRLFYHDFYGEGFEISPALGDKSVAGSTTTYTRAADDRPYACLVWSGRGRINGHTLDVADMGAREYLVTPGTSMTLENTGEDVLRVYSVFPMV